MDQLVSLAMHKKGWALNIFH